MADTKTPKSKTPKAKATKAKAVPKKTTAKKPAVKKPAAKKVAPAKVEPKVEPVAAAVETAAPDVVAPVEKRGSWLARVLRFWFMYPELTWSGRLDARSYQYCTGKICVIFGITTLVFYLAVLAGGLSFAFAAIHGGNMLMLIPLLGICSFLGLASLVGILQLIPKIIKTWFMRTHDFGLSGWFYVLFLLVGNFQFGVASSNPVLQLIGWLVVALSVFIMLYVTFVRGSEAENNYGLPANYVRRPYSMIFRGVCIILVVFTLLGQVGQLVMASIN